MNPLLELARAYNAESTLQTAVKDLDISWSLLAAIGIRESGFQNAEQPNGNGYGVFQIDIGKNRNVSAQQALNVSWAAGWAANFLENNLDTLAGSFPKLNSSQLLQATADSYNLGVRGISGNPNTFDAGSTGNNYGSNFLNIMDCFH